MEGDALIQPPRDHDRSTAAEVRSTAAVQLIESRHAAAVRATDDTADTARADEATCPSERTEQLLLG